MSNVIVIGAGLAGLASSIRLAKLGLKVQVFESTDTYGGKAKEIRRDGFRFDAGPSLFTMPNLVAELLDDSAQFDFLRLETLCNYFWEDGTEFSAKANQDEFCRDAESTFGVAASKIRKWLDRSSEIYDITSPVFLEQSLHKRSTFLSKAARARYSRLPRILGTTSLHKANKKQLGDEKLTQLFDRYATYNGSNPYTAPGTLLVIPHLESKIGAFLPKEGIAAIPKALYQQALALGVEFNFKSQVDRILHSKSKLIGVRVGGTEHLASRVVCNMDVIPAYEKLLPELSAPKRVRKAERSSSALIFYWGIKGKHPRLDAHNILFSKDYKKEFSHLFDSHSLYSDPSVYINITSKYLPADAPRDCENWFVMINAPHLKGQDWETLIPKARISIIRKIENTLGVDIRDKIICEEILSPQDIQDRTSSHLGSLYGTSSNSKWAAFFRHPNFSNTLKGLYFVGGSVHPGGGIPLCMYSAKITADIIAKDHVA